MPSILDVANQLAAENLPVLFLDTCVLLDVIRAPCRHLSGCVESAADLLRLLSGTTASCRFVAASFVTEEWNDNQAGTSDELRRHLVRIQESATHFHDACDCLGISRSFSRPSYHAIGLVDALNNHSRQLLASAIVLDRHPDTDKRGTNRVLGRLPPSQKGGELKDCIIVEECLEVCRLLQAAGSARKRIFCTSNTEDYCASGKLHPNLAIDFGNVGLGFTTNLPWALHEVQT